MSIAALQPLVEVRHTEERVLPPTTLVSTTYKSYTKEQMKRRDLMICHRVLQDSIDLRVHGTPIWFEFVDWKSTRECRYFLKQEPCRTGLVHSTLSINVVHQFNVGSGSGNHRPVWVIVRPHSVCIPRGSHDHGCGAMLVNDSLIGITSPYELYMWTTRVSHDGEIDMLRLYLHAADNSMNSAFGLLPTYYPSHWQAMLVTLVHTFDYFVIITNLCSMFSLKEVPPSHQWWNCQKPTMFSTSVLYLSTLGALDHRALDQTLLPTTIESAAPNLSTPVVHTALSGFVSFWKKHQSHVCGWLHGLYISVVLKLQLRSYVRLPNKNIMVVIFTVIDTAVATTKCRELVTSQMWLMRASSYLLSVSGMARCVMRSLSLLRQEYIQRFSLLSTRSWVWLFYLRKTCDACCLELGYFTTLRGAPCSNFTPGMSSRSFVEKNSNTKHPIPLTDAAA